MSVPAPARPSFAIPLDPAHQFLNDVVMALQLISNDGKEGDLPLATALPIAMAAPLPPRTRAPYPPRRVRGAPTPTELTRTITSGTYLRRFFVTSQNAALLGVDAALVPAADPVSIPVMLVDDFERTWYLTYEQRTAGPSITGSLAKGWTQFCNTHGVSVGDAIRFYRPPDFPAGVVGSRVSVIRGQMPVLF